MKSLQRSCVIAVSLVVWYCCTSSTEKWRSIVYATSFSFLEACWYRVQENKYWTSWQQHYTLLLLAPLLQMPQVRHESFLQNIFMFPCKVWLFEIIAGYYLQLLYNGTNPAWVYHGPQVYCRGNITVSFSFWLRWFCLGLLFELVTFFLEG